jgi:hypothetical protein
LAGIIEPLNDRINKPEKKLSGPAECGGENTSWVYVGIGWVHVRRNPARYVEKKESKKEINLKPFFHGGLLKPVLGNHHKTSHPEGWLRRKDVKK